VVKIEEMFISQVKFSVVVTVILFLMPTWTFLLECWSHLGERSI